ncbi:uncharacterized protein LOC107418927 [Ziziphus jujuba]|uniref:Uncharacterized protein LOC107418927 n=1 Tax=Ziziphus jujuba TaxID=326968 RepID=A0ABM3IJA2_ZIZJJ|nr:uncharacterized protein LOC107418927 [Ziziphus jujuba]XP_048329592.2 uncharacterized protein LOC107418927 [Ziziphus jujuba]
MESAVICEKPHTVPNKKRKRCTGGLNNLNNNIDVCHDYPCGTASVDDIPLESSVSISTGLVSLKVEDTTMEPAATTCNDLVRVPKKKRKKKKPKSGSNNANIVDECRQDGASSECTAGINGKTSVEMSAPDADLSCSKKKKKKKKKKQKKKRDSDMEVAGSNATDVEESSLKKKKKDSDMEVAGNASNATDEEEISLKKKKKQKKKKNSDMEVAGSNATDVEGSSLKKKKKRKKKKISDMEVARSNATDVEESSLTTAQQSDLLTTENTGSLEVDHVLLGDKGCSGNSCPGDVTTTSVETISLGVHGVSTLAIEDIMPEKDSANSAGVLPPDEKKKRKRKKKKKTGLKDRICGHNNMNVSEVHMEKKNGVEVDEVHTRVDASNIEEDSSCRGNGSDNLSAGDPSCKALEVDNILLKQGPSPDLDVLNDDINIEKGPLQGLDALNDDVNLEKAPSPDFDALNDDVNLDTSVKDGELSQIDVSPERALVSHARKKLLILDVNGLLVDFVACMPNKYKPDIVISKKAVFKRPYCDEFLQFCFDKFNVGVWSSRTKKNIDTVVNFLMPVSKHKLLFCWDQSHCTMTGFNTIENRSKPLVLKELKKLWEKLDPDLPWERGDYDQTNTLLLDDSPYKALRNPVNTAIFPYSYDYRDFEDTSLGPGGDLRVYLEKLAMAENVQKYVEQNPFGQKAITKSNPRWNFYCKILEPPR